MSTSAGSCALAEQLERGRWERWHACEFQRVQRAYFSAVPASGDPAPPRPPGLEQLDLAYANAIALAERDSAALADRINQARRAARLSADARAALTARDPDAELLRETAAALRRERAEAAALKVSAGHRAVALRRALDETAALWTARWPEHALSFDLYAAAPKPENLVGAASSAPRLAEDAAALQRESELLHGEMAAQIALIEQHAAVDLAAVPLEQVPLRPGRWGSDKAAAAIARLRLLKLAEAVVQDGLASVQAAQNRLAALEVGGTTEAGSALQR